MEEDVDNYIKELQSTKVEDIDYEHLLSHMLVHNKYYMDVDSILNELSLEKVLEIRRILRELGYEDTTSEIGKLHGSYGSKRVKKVSIIDFYESLKCAE